MAMHCWNNSLAARAAGKLQLAVVDASALTEELILEPSSLSIAVQASFSGEQVGIPPPQNGLFKMTYCK